MLCYQPLSFMHEGISSILNSAMAQGEKWSLRMLVPVLSGLQRDLALHCRDQLSKVGVKLQKPSPMAEEGSQAPVSARG